MDKVDTHKNQNGDAVSQEIERTQEERSFHLQIK